MLRSALLLLAACHAAAPRANPLAIDRFSDAAGHLQRRSTNPSLPAPGAPIDFDRLPLITHGLAPSGEHVRYYNFDIQSTMPIARYRFVRAGSRDAIAGQPDVIDAIPGDADYSDFQRLAYVEVPADFAPGSITSTQQIRGTRIADRALIDCPVVPPGSTTREQGVEHRALYYRGSKIECLEFQTPLAVDDAGRVPTSPIYVTFVDNGGPPKGFRFEADATQTHNVVMSVPGDVDYSPLWAVHIYDQAAFPRVHDAQSALAAKLLDANGPLVNCPIVSMPHHQ